jgi:hypothetical protein
LKTFNETLNEAVLYSFGRVLAGYDAFAQHTVLLEVGRLIREYLSEEGFDLPDLASTDDLPDLLEYFKKQGFMDSVGIQSTDKGMQAELGNLYGYDAYVKLSKVNDNPFLSCPLNAVVMSVADDHEKALVLREKTFSVESKTVTSVEELVDRSTEEGETDSLVIENYRLLRIAAERSEQLEASLLREREATEALRGEVDTGRLREQMLLSAVNEVKVLQGLLPICSHCKRIRSDDGYWAQIEHYITDHSEATFTHGICGDCYDEFYSEYGIENDDGIATWATPSGRIRVLTDMSRDTTIAKIGTGADMADRIAALDRMYTKHTTANILWDLRGTRVASAARLDDEEVERDSNYIIRRILSSNAQSAAKRRKTAFVFDSDADVVGAYARRTAEIYR